VADVADFGISYSHKDGGIAARVRQELQRGGASVWMDEAGDGTGGAEDIALPWGQDHWNVITTEFAAADVVVIVDTPNWRASPYCRDEYRFLLDWGKAVDFIPAPAGDLPPDELSSTVAVIVAGHADRRVVTSAHARLVQATRSGQSPKQSRAERLLGRAEERDARLLLASTPQTSGVTMTPAVTAHARAALERATSARKRLRRAGVSTVAVLAVLAVVGVVALAFTRAAYRSAAESSARSQSLELASRAQSEPDTVKALALARRADELAHDTASAEAVNAAAARDARMRTITVGPEEFYGAAWAADAPLVVGYSATKLITIDTDKGVASKPIEVPEGIQYGSVAVSADGSSAAYVTHEGRELKLAHLTEGRTEGLGVSGVSAVATGDGTDLWWATDGGGIAAAQFANPVSLQHHYAVPATVYAMDVTPERDLLDYVDAAGRVHTTTYDDATLTEVDGFEVATADKVASVDRQAVGALKRCGENLYGGLAGSAPINGTEFSRVDGVVNTDRLFGSMTKPVCSDGDTAWFSTVASGAPHAFSANVRRPYVPLGSNRYLAVDDPADKRSAVLTDDGKFYETFERNTRPFSADGAVSVLPMTHGDVYLMGVGDVVDVATGAVTGHMDSPVPSSASLLGDDAMVVTISGIAHVDAHGRAQKVVDLGDTDAVNYLRSGSDGKHFVATFATSVLLVDRDGSRTVKVRIGDLQFGESLADADISPDGGSIAFATNSGRVGAVAVNAATGSATAPQMWKERLPGGNHIRVSYVPATGELIVVPTDGAVRLLDADFNVVARSFFGVEAEHLTTVGEWAIISSLRGGTVLYDSRNMLVRDRITVDEVPSTPSTARLDLPHKRLVLLAYIDHSGKGAVRFDVPLPGL
jgi:hypothetical protein